MAIHGNVGEFNPDREDWVSYTERLVQYFVANSITEEAADKRSAILLSSCGAATYQLIRNLVAPGRPTDKSFSELVALVKDHHQPCPSMIVQRFNFHMRTQIRVRQSVTLLPRCVNFQNTVSMESHLSLCSGTGWFVDAKIIVYSVNF